VKRRGFIAVTAGMAAWPLAGHAQQAERLRRVGVLMPYAENDPITRAFVTAFAQALERFAWVEGKNIRIDYRFASGDPALFKTYAAELVGLSPDAILASSPPAVAALREQTRTIPIVFVLVVDPVGLGFAQSLARPGGNITGFSGYDAPMMGKWLQLLKKVAPRVSRVAVIFNPGGSLLTLPDSFNATHRDAIIAAASRLSLPLMGLIDIFPRAGALMSYGIDPVDLYAQAASYIDRILKGASPADLPVQQPTKFSLVINLKTARALGLTVPPSMLDLADEVIE